MSNTSSLVQSGTKTFVTGTASGIDTSALVEIGVQQRTKKADLIDINISSNNSKVAAYSELQQLSIGVENALKKLTNQSKKDLKEANVFDTRAGFLNASDGSNPAGTLDVTVDDGAPKGTFNVKIIQQAKSHKIIGTSVADSNSDLGYNGSFKIGLAGEDGVQIDIVEGQSLSDIANAINEKSLTTHVSATILKVSETEYQLALTANKKALNIETSVVSGDDIMNFIGVSDGEGEFNTVLETPQPAIIELDGVSITRNDNTFDDLIDGIIIDVNNEKPGVIYTLRVDHDTAAVKTAITDFIDAYNTLRDFIIKHSAVSADGVVSDDAVLFSDTLLKGLDLAASGLLSASAGSSSLITSLRDLGIDLDGNNKLYISDNTELEDVLLKNLIDVEKLFAFSITDDHDEFALLANNSTFGNASFAMDITVDNDGNITKVAIDGDTSLFTVTGNLISGAAGSIYDGLKFAFAGDSSATVNVVISQGLADRLSNTLNLYSDSGSNGILQAEKARLDLENTALTTESARIREVAEQYREKEIARYAAMEAAGQKNKLLVKQIRAIFGLDKKNN